ncbi:MAG TPA: sulfite exporter TauE/SafE family protein [Acidimicrobiales bacterium]|nr:sulfite exporter TauE/SafE family protein [Acidimicrobiales bacterium]
MDAGIVVASALVGLVVGLTGAGGGALMTPMLVLLFSVKPSAAISSDLVAAVVMRPLGAGVHLRRRTVNLRLVTWMSAGSVPAAFAGAYVLREIGHTGAARHHVEVALGSALLLGAGAMAVRNLLDRRSGRQRRGTVRDVAVRPFATLAIGIFGGFVVGMTSVGAGSLMVVLLMWCYPTLAANQLVGTDLTQAIPLTASAALGALAFGHVELPLTASVALGGAPGVLVGSLLSSRVSDRLLRPAIGVVILVSGLKYVGVGTPELGLATVTLGALGAARWLQASARRRGTATSPAQLELPLGPHELQEARAPGGP